VGFDNAELPDNEFVNFEAPNPGATDHQTPYRDRADGESA
jgi:hypothetical protein